MTRPLEDLYEERDRMLHRGPTGAGWDANAEWAELMAEIEAAEDSPLHIEPGGSNVPPPTPGGPMHPDDLHELDKAERVADEHEAPDPPDDFGVVVEYDEQPSHIEGEEPPYDPAHDEPEAFAGLDLGTILLKARTGVTIDVTPEMISERACLDTPDLPWREITHRRSLAVEIARDEMASEGWPVDGVAPAEIIDLGKMGVGVKFMVWYL